MAKDFMIRNGRKMPDGDTNTDEILAVYLVDGEALSITSTEDDLDFEFGEFVENDPKWKEQAKQSSPLWEIFGRNGYTPGQWHNYDESTQSIYDDAVAACKKRGAVTKTFKPKGR